MLQWIDVPLSYHVWCSVWIDIESMVPVEVICSWELGWLAQRTNQAAVISDYHTSHPQPILSNQRVLTAQLLNVHVHACTAPYLRGRLTLQDLEELRLVVPTK